MRVNNKTFQMEMFKSLIQMMKKSPEKARENGERQKVNTCKYSSLIEVVIVLHFLLRIMSPSFWRKTKMMENQSHNDLCVEEDDIITDVHASISQRSLFSAPLGHSHPIGKVFVEKNREFHFGYLHVMILSLYINILYANNDILVTLYFKVQFSLLTNH